MPIELLLLDLSPLILLSTGTDVRRTPYFGEGDVELERWGRGPWGYRSAGSSTYEYILTFDIIFCEIIFRWREFFFEG